LPGNIHGGVARLSEAKIGVYRETESTKKNGTAGQKFLYMAGIVQSPATAIHSVKVFEAGHVKVVSVKEVSIVGQRTSQTMPFCETRTQKGAVQTADQNVARALNEIRTIAGPDSTKHLQSEEDLASLLEVMKSEKPLFRFSTTQGDPSAEFPNPRVWENWLGAYNEPMESALNNGAPMTQDQSAEAPAEAQEEEEPAVDTRTLEELVEASENDEAAQEELKSRAISAGVSEADIDGANSWEDVANLIPVPDGEVLEPWSPAKGEIYGYAPIDAKTKKPGKTIKVEIVAVDAKKETATLKGVANKTQYKDVKWASIIRD
jgi:hypothetical protein